MILSAMQLKPQADPERFERQCSGKEGYPSEDSALGTLVFMRGRRIKHWRPHRFRPEELEPYLCDYCLQWHLGH